MNTQVTPDSSRSWDVLWRRLRGMIKLEYRQHWGGFVYAPIAVAILLFLMMILATVTGEAKLSVNGQDLIPKGLAKLASSPEFAQHRASALTGPFLALAGLFHLVLSVVLVNFFLSSLFDERKDRSILFWKSLPVGDVETVLVRFGTAILLAPLIYAAALLVSYLLVLMFASYAVWRLDESPLRMIWSAANPLSLTVKFLVVQWLSMLWLAPVFAWLMLCSAWAKARPILWAVLIPGVGYLLATWLRWTTSINTGLDSIVAAAWVRIQGFVFPFSGRYIADIGAQQIGAPKAPVDFLVGPAFDKFASLEPWIGIAIAGLMVYAAIQLRRHRDDAL